MPIICWGNLAKSADDTERIEQSIQGYVEGHDENPNAHMGADYSLGAHRLMVQIDHLPYSARNALFYPQARTYKAIVDPTGNADTTTIQAAIDYVNGLGGGTIFIKAGTYIQTADITMYDDVELVGENNNDVIIDFNETEYGIVINGKRNARIKDVKVINSVDIAIYLNATTECLIEGVNFSGNDYDIKINGYCYRNKIRDIYSVSAQTCSLYVNVSAHDIALNEFSNIVVSGSLGVGIYITGGYQSYFKRVIVVNPTDIGFNIVSSNIDRSIFEACVVYDGDAVGFYLNGVDRATFLGCEAVSCADDGFQLITGAANIFNACHLTDNNGYGISLDANSTNNVVVGNYLNDNDPADIQDLGSGNVIEANFTGT